MRERLKAAMQTVCSTDDYFNRRSGELRVILAAARAYSCDECNGTGEIGDTELRGDDCPACKSDRELADGVEGQ